jgi:hypothetical protein
MYLNAAGTCATPTGTFYVLKPGADGDGDLVATGKKYPGANPFPGTATTNGHAANDYQHNYGYILEVTPKSGSGEFACKEFTATCADNNAKFRTLPLVKSVTE